MLGIPFGPLKFAMPVLLLLTLGCGTGRELQSVAVTPAVADGQNFPNGVAFSATGTFSKPPSPQQLTSKDVTWCVGGSDGTCAGNIAVRATVDANGVAKCVPGAVGAATILAGKSTPSMIPDEGAHMTVFGTAQLTCP